MMGRAGLARWQRRILAIKDRAVRIDGATLPDGRRFSGDVFIRADGSKDGYRYRIERGRSRLTEFERGRVLGFAAGASAVFDIAEAMASLPDDIADWDQLSALHDARMRWWGINREKG